MISVEEATRLVLSAAEVRKPVRCPLEDAHGRTLAEDVATDVDSPPFDKAMVDGFAVQAGDLNLSLVELEVVEEVMAGDVPTRSVAAGRAIRIMTGAPIPEGADAVVMVEQTSSLEPVGSRPPRVKIESTSTLKAGANILRRGTAMRAGDVVLQAPCILRPAEIGLLAECGVAKTLVIAQPRVAILSTGNELVASDETPERGQIRNSNGPLLTAAVSACGALPLSLGIARDDRADLTAALERGISGADVLVVSGGVSAGDLDLVPEVLGSLGVERVFHKVSLKPGKPVWFGRKGSGADRVLVFGLPGNPVSSLVCFHLFVRQAIEKMSGRVPSLPRSSARLDGEHHQRGDRPTYFPSQLSGSGADATVAPVAWRGSADLRSLTAANCLAFFPAGDRRFRAGERVDVIWLS